MNSKHYAFLVMSVALGCTIVKQAQPPKTTAASGTIKDVEAVLVPKPITTYKVYKAPKFKFVLAKGQTIDLSTYLEAAELIEKHANSDQFYTYVKFKRTYFSNANGIKVQEAVEKFRDQLNSGEEIIVKFYTPFFSSKAIGGWNGDYINENTKFKMSAVERAGHLLHETSHKYGWSHQGNYVNKFDNVNSFPYAIGYDLEDYILGLEKQKLTGSL